MSSRKLFHVKGVRHHAAPGPFAADVIDAWFWSPWAAARLRRRLRAAGYAV